MANILAIEFQSVRTEHLNLNAQILAELMTAGYTVRLASTREHYDLIQEALGLSLPNVSLSHLPKGVIRRLRAFCALWRALTPYVSQSTIVLVLSAPGTYYAVIPLFLRIARKVFVIHHGLTENVLSESLYLRVKFRLLFRYLGVFNRLRNIFLSMHIQGSLRTAGLSSPNYRFLRLPHKKPLIPKAFPPAKSLKVRTYGVQSLEKGFAESAWLVTELRKMHVDAKIVGSASVAVRRYIQERSLDIQLPTGLIDADQFAREIAEADIVFFTYPHNLYRVTASSAYFDAVVHGSLIFAFKHNPFFQEEAKYNANLILVSDREAMLRAITRCVESPSVAPLTSRNVVVPTPSIADLICE